MAGSRHLRLWRVVCLLTVTYQLGLSSRYGCLFEKKLCSREQFCSDDRLFGQCLSSRQEQVQYQVSVKVLQRLQEVLKELMLQGLSWQDDITQYIIAKELGRVPHTTTKSLRAPPSQPAQVPSSKAYSDSKSGGGQAQTFVDYMIVDPPASSLRMQAMPLDPYTYHQHGYQDDRERSPPPLGDVAYPHPHPRPSLRPGGQKKERERERQLLQDLLSLYLSSAQPSFRHRGAAALPAAPFYEDLDLLQDYTDDYSLPEQPPGRQRAPHKAAHVQDYSSLSGLDDVTLSRMGAILERYGIDPRELTPQQLHRLAVALQRPRAQQTDQFPLEDITLKETELVDAVSQQGSRSSSAPPHPITPAPSAPLAPTSGAAGTPPGPVVPIMLADLQAKAESAGLGGSRVREEYGYIVTNQSQLSLSDGVRLLQALAERIHLATSSFINISVVGPALTFRIRQNSQNVSAEEVANKAVAERNFLEGETGLKIVQTGVGERSEGRGLVQATRVGDSSRGVVLGLVAMACVGGVLVAALAVTCVRHHARQLEARKLGLGPEGGTETHFDYQELCRQHMAAKTSFSRPEAGGRRGTDTSRVSSVSSQFSDGPQHSPSSHSSTPSWSEEPAQSNMDISTGHMILAYMEDHLKNKDRLQKEWEALCSYQAEPSSVSVARGDGNVEKNRYPDFVPYDHSRVKMKAENNPSREDYINASTIIDHDPRMPAYIATQGPLPHTISDFWQMVWENGSTVIVMITALVEDGEKMCERYWPDEGSSLYNIYEVNLVSEHIWCKDFLVRSFYLKNVQTQETRTLTQFHLLSWPAQGIPTSTRPMLDFRRKVNKCYRGRSCPIIVHCSDGTGRSGTYMLIDMVLNRMAKGVKEIDIAATLEHIRDQRPNMVRTKEQFEFALTAVAEEVNAILKALPQ
ncbi:protein tyrosine phosphatase receptor type Na isoform X1 [Denticeps clupeoides]|uniref:Receptor-type tyrosine-protein phosphatase-like N n=2 Tax=Denticeps clupeoides TaxID=299321 RepID=A0AAY4CE27_9TELE|nr:receptor-type tyrosine-protein phosphatase-like N isoform X1 [Denticeps clupeoides]